MFLAEPPPSSADLHFRVLGFPVRVHPWFWVVLLLLGMSSGAGEPRFALTWVVVAFVSVVVHELGHALLQRRFGGEPRIVLYSFGGLAICDDCDRTPGKQIAISLAGPLAGFLFAAVTALALSIVGHQVGIAPLQSVPRGADGVWIILGWLYFMPFETPLFNTLVSQLFGVNIWWGLLNLLPIYPLDGGRVSRELCTLWGDPRRGISVSLWISIITAAAAVALALMLGQIFTVIFFAFMAFSNYQTLQSYRQRSSYRGW